MRPNLVWPLPWGSSSSEEKQLQCKLLNTRTEVITKAVFSSCSQVWAEIPRAEGRSNRGRMTPSSCWNEISHVQKFQFGEANQGKVVGLFIQFSKALLSTYWGVGTTEVNQRLRHTAAFWSLQEGASIHITWWLYILPAFVFNDLSTLLEWYCLIF